MVHDPAEDAAAVRAGYGVVNGLVVNRFLGNGIVVDGGEGNHVVGCSLGIDPAATEARPNGGNGIVFVGNGLARIEHNTIAGNRGNGILLRNVTGTIAFNRIGLRGIPNGASGIDIASHAAVRLNEIAYNTLHGILVSSNQRAELLGNRIHRNGLLSIDYGSNGPDANDALDSDPGHPNAPLVEGVREMAPFDALEISGRIYSKPHEQVTVQFFASPHRQQFGLAEAAELAGDVTVTTDADGFAMFRAVGLRGGFIGDGWLAATATTSEGTSELSDAIPLDTAAFDVTTTADSGEGSLREVIAAVNAAACSAESYCAIAFRVPDEELRALRAGDAAARADSATSANGGAAIDRGSAVEVPELLSATFDDATGFTIVRARSRADATYRVELKFYANGTGAREGEVPRLHRIEGREGDVTLFGVRGLPRGAFVTATRSLVFCHFELGCAGVDTSEFSNAVRVE